MSLPDRVVFDAEPLVAHADDEPGSEAVTTYLDAVGGEEIDGSVSLVTTAEVRYVLARKYDSNVADDYLDWLWTIGIEPVDVGELWIAATEFILAANPSLGDAFALATADHADATLLVGADTDYDGIEGISIEQFRHRSA